MAASGVTSEMAASVIPAGSRSSAGKRKIEKERKNKKMRGKKKEASLAPAAGNNQVI